MAVTIDSLEKIRRNHLAIGLVSSGILLAGLLANASAEKVSVFGTSIPTLCGFKLLTTWDCPGCGLTRSLLLALRGEWHASYALHIWGIPLMMILWLQLPYRLYRSVRPAILVPKLPVEAKRWLNLAIFLSILLPWIARTISSVVIRYL